VTHSPSAPLKTQPKLLIPSPRAAAPSLPLVARRGPWGTRLKTRGRNSENAKPRRPHTTRKDQSVRPPRASSSALPVRRAMGQSLEDAAQVIDSIAASRRAFITFGGPPRAMGTRLTTRGRNSENAKPGDRTRPGKTKACARIGRLHQRCWPAGPWGSPLKTQPKLLIPSPRAAAPSLPLVARHGPWALG
jgi:hypothetical protein